MRTVGLTPHLLDRWCVTVQSMLPHLKHLLRRSTKADLLPLPRSPRENHFPSQGKFKDMLMLTKDWLTLQFDHCRWGGGAPKTNYRKFWAQGTALLGYGAHSGSNRGACAVSCQAHIFTKERWLLTLQCELTDPTVQM